MQDLLERARRTVAAAGPFPLEVPMLSVPPLPPEFSTKPRPKVEARPPVEPGSDEDLLARRAAGDSMSKIAKDLGVNVSTISRRLKKLEGR